MQTARTSTPRVIAPRRLLLLSHGQPQLAVDVLLPRAVRLDALIGGAQPAVRGSRVVHSIHVHALVTVQETNTAHPLRAVLSHRAGSGEDIVALIIDCLPHVQKPTEEGVCCVTWADGRVDVVFDSRGGTGCPAAKPIASSSGNLEP
eukprot:scaffold42199_cov36-Tisochrysis_lutea.AAC.2